MSPLSHYLSTLALGRHIGSGHSPRRHSLKGVLFRHVKHCIFGTKKSGTVRRFNEPPTITLCFLFTCCYHSSHSTQRYCSDVESTWNEHGDHASSSSLWQSRVSAPCSAFISPACSNTLCAETRTSCKSSLHLADYEISIERVLRTKLCRHCDH